MDLWNSGFFIAVIAHGVIGISLVWDKILLKQNRSKSVVNYVFWLGAMSVFGSVLALFGMHLPSLGMILMAIGAGAVHLIGVFFYYWGLNLGEASQTLAIMGGFSPIATALIAWPLLDSNLTGLALWGFVLMTAGGFFMFFSEKLPMRKMFPVVVLSAAFFGLGNVMQKIAFDNTSGFVTAYVFYTIGTFGCALIFLVRKRWREDIFAQAEHAGRKKKISYFSNRVTAGVGSLLIFLAISKTHPAIVEAISGLRYVIVFAGAYGVTKLRPQWLSEDFTPWGMTAKTIATGLVVTGLFFSGFAGGQGGSATSGNPRLLPARGKTAPSPSRTGTVQNLQSRAR